MDARGGRTPAGQSQLGLCWAHLRKKYSYEYVVVEYLQHQYREHSKAQRNQPCTKQKTKYVPIRVHVKSMYVKHACGVRAIFLEDGALGISMLEHVLHLSFRSIARYDYAKRLVCMYRYMLD